MSTTLPALEQPFEWVKKACRKWTQLAFLVSSLTILGNLFIFLKLIIIIISVI